MPKEELVRQCKRDRDSSALSSANKDKYKSYVNEKPTNTVYQ